MLEPTGHPFQQAIACLVAIVVVDQLEVVQIHEHQRKAPAHAAISLEGLHQTIAIEQPGERVVPGQMAVLQLFEFAVGNIAHGEQYLCPLLDMPKLILEPAHPLPGTTLPFCHHLVEA